MKYEVDLLSVLNSLQYGCIYLLKHKTKPQVFVKRTKNLLGALTHLLKDRNKKSLSFVTNYDVVVVEEVGQDEMLLRIRESYWKRVYKKDGYEILNPRMATNFTVKMKYKFNRSTPLVIVYLEDCMRVKNIVGIFESKPEADEFLDKYYNKFSEYNTITIANNEPTKKYFQKQIEEAKYQL